MTAKISVPPPPADFSLPARIVPDVTVVVEHFPHIGQKIKLGWGSTELQKYLNSIIFDERGTRRGFPVHVASALLRIHHHHGKLLPEDASGWNGVVS